MVYASLWASVSYNSVILARDYSLTFSLTDNQNAHLLTPAFAHGLVPASESVSVSDLEALLLESEADIRAADRDLREIAELEARGVLDAGKLPSECFTELFSKITFLTMNRS